MSDTSEGLLDKWPCPSPEPSGSRHSSFFRLRVSVSMFLLKCQKVCCSLPCCIPKQEVAWLLAGAGCLTERNKQKAARTQFAKMFYPLCAVEGASLVRRSLWRVPKAEESGDPALRVGSWWMLAWENLGHGDYLRHCLVQRWQLPLISDGCSGNNGGATWRWLEGGHDEWCVPGMEGQKHICSLWSHGSWSLN